METKKILITGATDGLGLATTKTLAALGHSLILIGRNKVKLQLLKEKLELNHGNEIWVYTTDLSLIKEIKQVAEKILAEHDVLDVIINNAGGVFSSFQITSEGLEKTIALNHFNYFLLTDLLLPLLQKSKSARIINVSSNSHYGGKIDEESFTRNKNYFLLTAYNQSKLANLLFTYHLAEKLKDSGITVNALSPERVNTKAGYKQTAWWVKLVWGVLVSLKSVPMEQAVKTYIYLALSDEVKNVTGKYFENCKEKESSKLSYNKSLAATLWKFTEDKINSIY